MGLDSSGPPVMIILYGPTNRVHQPRSISHAPSTEDHQFCCCSNHNLWFILEGPSAIEEHPPVFLDEVGSLLTDHDDGSVGVARCDDGHDGGVHHPQSRHAPHPEGQDTTTELVLSARTTPAPWVNHRSCQTIFSALPDTSNWLITIIPALVVKNLYTIYPFIRILAANQPTGLTSYLNKVVSTYN